MVKVIRNYDSPDYNEIGQTKKVRFAVGVWEDDRNSIRVLHAPFICRDYFNEVVAGLRYKKRFRQYGFEFDGRTQEWEERPAIVVQFHDVDKLKLNLPIIHMYEDKMGLSHTVIHDTEEEDTLIYEGDPHWKDFPFMISFWSLLIRISAYDNIPLDGSDIIRHMALVVRFGNDASICRTLQENRKVFDNLLEYWDKIIEGAEMNGYKAVSIDTDYLHNECGIAGVMYQLNGMNTRTVLYKNYQELGLV